MYVINTSKNYFCFKISVSFKMGVFNISAKVDLVIAQTNIGYIILALAFSEICRIYFLRFRQNFILFSSANCFFFFFV